MPKFARHYDLFARANSKKRYGMYWNIRNKKQGTGAYWAVLFLLLGEILLAEGFLFML